MKGVFVIKRGFALVTKAVIVKSDKVLILVRSKKEIEKSKFNNKLSWDLPGGGMSVYEKCEDGLLREISEETKLSTNIIKPLSVFDTFKNKLHLVIITYLCEYISGEVSLSSEHESYKWYTINELKEAKAPFWLINDCEKALNEYNLIKNI